MRADGSNDRRLTNDSGSSWLLGWTVDGQKILYWSFPGSPYESFPEVGRYELKSLEIATGEEGHVAHYSQPLERWDELVITDVHTLEPGPFEMPGEPATVRFVDLTWTPDFRHWIVVTAESVFEWGYTGVGLYWLDLAESRVITVGTDVQIGLSLAQTSDGTRVALTAYNLDKYSAGVARTYVLDMETGQVHVIGQDTLWFPRWSPDGTMLSFQAPLPDGQGSSFVYTLGTGEIYRLPNEFYRSHWSLSWAPRTTYGPTACVSEP